MAESPSDRTPLAALLVELFSFGNLTFLALDIYLAHSINQFAHPAEWIPIVFSATIPFLLIPGILQRRHRTGFNLRAGYVVGGLSALVGVIGMALHLDSGFFQEQTPKALVYAAPFVGPLSYTGVGLLLILNRLESCRSPAWGVWVVFLAMCGFLGNLALSLGDHAQNGFFEATEWVPVFASAYGFSFLFIAICYQRDTTFLKACLAVMAVQILVGVLGFGLHLMADVHGPAQKMTENFIYGAPIFAPLLFANLAILAMIGLCGMKTLQKLPQS